MHYGLVHIEHGTNYDDKGLPWVREQLRRVLDSLSDLSRAEQEREGDALRDAAITAFTDAVERPHAGRAGEFMDALDRYLREERRAR